MATALDREILDDVEGPPPARPRNDNAEMNEEWQGPAPARFVVREIDFNMVNGKLQFSYRSSEPAQPLPAEGMDAVIAGLVQPPAAPVGAFGAATVAAVPPPAPETPLDLNVTASPLHIIFMLSEPRNMSFSGQLKAITHKNGDDKPWYGGLRHVGENGEQSRAPLAGCKLIHFVANPPAGPYRHSFNFNVDLEQDPGPGGEIRLLPITIDPDIRNPGGSDT